MRVFGRFLMVAIVSIVPLSAGVAQKLVDPDKVAPEYRAAAEKRRAEQLKLMQCSRKVDAEKVLPRDRAAHVEQCLDQP